MKRKIILLFAAGAFAAARRVLGQAYSGSVLYPLTLPSGYQNLVVITIVSGQAVGAGDPTSNVSHALLWSADGSVADLNPTNLTGYTFSEAVGTDGTHQVGYGAIGGSNSHALLWSGTADSAVDLDPTNLTGYSYCQATAISGNQQVGNGATYDTLIHENETHALLWSGAANTAVDLNPQGWVKSYALGTDGTQQVGWGWDPTGFFHAVFWSGTAASAVDLNPTGFVTSYATAVSGGQQVGWGYGGYNAEGIMAERPLLWSGTAASAIDLSPTDLTGFDQGCEVNRTNGTQQVGYGYGTGTGFEHHALSLVRHGRVGHRSPATVARIRRMDQFDGRLHRRRG